MPVADTSLHTPVSAVAAGCGGVGPAVPAPVAMATQQQHRHQHQQQQQRPSARKQPLQQVDENGIDVCSSSLSLAAVAAASAAAHAPVPPPELEHSLVDRVRSSLELHMLDNALFLAERLVADFPSEVRILRSIRFSKKKKPIDLPAPFFSFLSLSTSFSLNLFLSNSFHSLPPPPTRRATNRPTTASSPTSTSAPTPRTGPAPPWKTRGSSRSGSPGAATYSPSPACAAARRPRPRRRCWAAAAAAEEEEEGEEGEGGPPEAENVSGGSPLLLPLPLLPVVAE